ncbi:conserved hypothetical protein [Ricinus communis]|uniref:Uncharacterized protein n=1 Tax=Ricinus communis TaxID=3988 RepID=B9RIK5_RICCO|nr:conserved hypothetical protein [Ricinus communis]
MFNLQNFQRDVVVVVVQMICNTCIRSVIAQGAIFSGTRSRFGNIRRRLHAGLHLNYSFNHKSLMNISMMIDSSSTAKRGLIVDVLQEKDDDGGYVSGGWKR